MGQLVVHEIVRQFGPKIMSQVFSWNLICEAVFVLTIYWSGIYDIPVHEWISDNFLYYIFSSEIWRFIC